ncbi:MAG: bifunctional methionine sulfoxide reductase B/A protein [Phycisphaerales bacterium]|jgi:peptide methionine sulfoxide reductase msrA/msrB
MKVVGLLAIGLVLSSLVALGLAQASSPPAAKSGSPEVPAKESSSMPVTPRYSASAHDITPLSKDRIQLLAAKLSKEDADVILAKGTERPFCGNLLDNKKEGVYVCKLCSLPLFSSDSKFNSGTGWPSFFKPFDKAHVGVHVDRSHGMVREEIVCARCNGHLGHVFDDGPEPTGLRFCLNSASLTFFEKGTELPAESRPIPTRTAYFAGGCFWGVEDRFAQLPGVIDAVSGYMGGSVDNPTYRQVCNGTTGHAETVRIVFDPTRITYPQLLERFFKFHDPTQLNRQGPDIGDQYRSAIFATDDEQLRQSQEFIAAQAKTARFEKRKIVTVVDTAAKAGKFYDAEEYHQDYHAKNGGHCPMPEE